MSGLLPPGVGAIPKIAKKKRPIQEYPSTHEYKMDDGTVTVVNRAPWESAPAFHDRCAYFDSLDPRNAEEAATAEAKSAMWYNMKYLGCGYDKSLEDNVGNPETLVVVNPMPDANKNQKNAGGTRNQGWMPK